MRTNKFPDLRPVSTSILNNYAFSSSGNVCPITAFLGCESTPPVKAFMRTTIAMPVALTKANGERTFHIGKLVHVCRKIHPLIQYTLAKSPTQSRAASRGTFPSSKLGNFLFVVRDEYGAEDKLLLR